MKLSIPQGDVEILRKFAPNYGYFGSSPWNQLTINVETKIDMIRLVNASDEPEYLNLWQLELISGGRDVSRSLHELAEYTVSSCMTAGHQKAYNLVLGGGFHSELDRGASWEIRFPKVENIDQIIIKNRWDVYGRRSRNMRVLVGMGDHVSVIYDPLNIGQFGWLLELLKFVPKAAEGEQSSFRADLLTRAKEAVLAVPDPYTHKITQYLQLIDQREVEASLKQLNIELLAVVTGRYLAAGASVETKDLHQFSDLLSHKSDVVEYEKALNRVLVDSSLGHVTVSRHFVLPAPLLNHKAGYCAQIQEIFSLASMSGVDICLGYGTLLGCVRDGGFIPHDDDVDLIMRVPKNQRAAVDAYLQSLRQHGYDVAQFIGHEHYNATKSNLSIELFPAVEDGHKATLYMQNMEKRSVPFETLFPLRDGIFYGMKVKVPNRPEDFLERRYGKMWRHPDRFYEWRWELKGDDPTAPVLSEAVKAAESLDEERYLELNPDVARAIKAGAIPSARNHYLLHGWKEGRPVR